MPRNIDPGIAHHKARVAALTMRDASPERIEQARADLKAAGLRERIKRDVATWPPLSAETKAELAVLLLAGDGDAT